MIDRRMRVYVYLSCFVGEADFGALHILLT